MPNHSIKTKQGAVAKGIYTITKAKIETPEQWTISKEIDRLRQAGREFMHLVRQLNSMCQVQVTVIENVVPIVGRAMIANNLTSVSPTNSMLINKVALGSDVTAPNEADTVLGTEVYRNDQASRTSADEIAYVSGFFNATETTGTYKEAGLFSDGTASVDTGVLVSHVAIDITKTSVETLTIDWELQFNLP